MPFIVAAETGFDDPTTSYSQSIPAGHQANDVLIAIVAQDTGTTTITASGWTQIGTQATAQGQRTTAFWKLAASSNEADLDLTGANDEWVVTIIVIRGADTTAPIHQNNRTDSVNSTTAFLDSGTVTTTENNCLLLYAWGFDNTNKLTIEDPNSLVNLGKQNSAGNCLIVGYRNHLTAGATPVLRALSEVASEGGSALVLAIVDANPSTPQMGPDCREAYTLLQRYGGITTATTSTAAFTRHDGITWDVATTLTPTAINGLDIIDIATFTQVTYQATVTPWGGSTGLSCAGSALDTTGRWVGATHAISATDFSGRIFSVQFNMSYTKFARFGRQGCIVVFEDSSNNWAAFQLSISSGLIAGVEYTAFIDVERTPTLDESGSAIDWTDVTRIGYLFHKRTTSTSAVIMRVRNSLLLNRTTLVDGSANAPITPAFFFSVLAGWDAYLTAGLQGAGQALLKSGVRYGDGVRASYTAAAATSFEMPLRATPSIGRRFWTVPDDSPAAEFRVLASANDVVNLNACVIATDTRQDFVIDPTTSGSASYDFAGASVVGWRVLNDVVAFNSVTFQRCHGILLNGGSMVDCSVLAPASSPAVTTDDPGNIEDTAFESSGAGHAIEITATGSFTLTNLTYTGYGADETTDAAIYNNSGGAVTLTIAGGDTPTVRNGAGASTTIVVNPVTVLIGVADAVTGDPVENARVLVHASSGAGPLPYNDSVSITRSGSTATVSHTAHGIADGKKVLIRGATEQEYNGVHTITVTGPNAYTFAVSGSPATPATGAPTATGVVLEGLTDVNGEISDTRSYSANQPITGRARKSTSSPFYKTTNIGGVVSNTTGYSATIVLILDE